MDITFTKKELYFGYGVVCFFITLNFWLFVINHASVVCIVHASNLLLLLFFLFILSNIRPTNNTASGENDMKEKHPRPGDIYALMKEMDNPFRESVIGLSVVAIDKTKDGYVTYWHGKSAISDKTPETRLLNSEMPATNVERIDRFLSCYEYREDLFICATNPSKGVFEKKVMKR